MSTPRTLMLAAATVTFGLSLIPPATRAGEASNALEALSEERRADIFQKFLNSGDIPCGAVTKILFRGDNDKDNGAAYYTVRCEPGGDWMISIQNEGQMSTRVTSCADMNLVGASCWEPF